MIKPSCLLLSGLLFSCTALAADLVATVTVESSSDGGTWMRFTITNRDTKGIRLYRESLPWIDRPGSLMLKAIQADASFAELRGVGRIHDVAGAISIAPGESISDVVKLNSRFRQLSSSLESSSVAIYWLWLPRSPDVARIQPKAGVEIIAGAE